MLRVDSVEGLLGVRVPFACLVFLLVVCADSTVIVAVLSYFFRYIRMHNFAAVHSRRCEFAHLCSGGVRLLFEARVWLHF